MGSHRSHRSHRICTPGVKSHGCSPQLCSYGLHRSHKSHWFFLMALNLTELGRKVVGHVRVLRVLRFQEQRETSVRFNIRRANSVRSVGSVWALKNSEICVRPKSAHTRAHEKKARLQNRAVLFYLYNVWIIFPFWEPLWCKPCWAVPPRRLSRRILGRCRKWQPC